MSHIFISKLRLWSESSLQVCKTQINFVPTTCLRELTILVGIIYFGSLTIGCGNGLGLAFDHANNSTAGSASTSPGPGGALDPPEVNDPNGSAEPLPEEYTLSDWNEPFPPGVAVQDCLSDSRFNLCLIYKNPVFQVSTQSISPVLSTSSASEALEKQMFTLGVRVPDTGDLANENIRIIPPKNLAEPDKKLGWKFRYQGDEGRKVVQIQTFYGLNRFINLSEIRTGKSYIKGKAVAVVAYAAKVVNNASWDGTKINLGIIGSTRVGLGLDLSVVVHEASHANLFYATRGIHSVVNCKSATGCFAAINEGAADFQSAIIYPEAGPVVGELFVNNKSGIRSSARYLQGQHSARQIFTNYKGEVHAMGELYANLWYYVWSNVDTDEIRMEVETAFTEHLASLSTSDTFLTALENIKTLLSNSSPHSEVIISLFEEVYQRLEVS